MQRIRKPRNRSVARRLLELRAFDVTVLHRHDDGRAGTPYFEAAQLTVHVPSAVLGAELVAEVCFVASAEELFQYRHDRELADLVERYRSSGNRPLRHGDVLTVQDDRGTRSAWTYTDLGMSPCALVAAHEAAAPSARGDTATRVRCCVACGGDG